MFTSRVSKWVLSLALVLAPVTTASAALPWLKFSGPNGSLLSFVNPYTFSMPVTVTNQGAPNTWLYYSIGTNSGVLAPGQKVVVTMNPGVVIVLQDAWLYDFKGVRGTIDLGV